MYTFIMITVVAIFCAIIDRVHFKNVIDSNFFSFIIIEIILNLALLFASIPGHNSIYTIPKKAEGVIDSTSYELTDKKAIASFNITEYKTRITFIDYKNDNSEYHIDAENLQFKVFNETGIRYLTIIKYKPIVSKWLWDFNKTQTAIYVLVR